MGKVILEEKREAPPERRHEAAAPTIGVVGKKTRNWPERRVRERENAEEGGERPTGMRGEERRGEEGCSSYSAGSGSGSETGRARVRD